MNPELLPKLISAYEAVEPEQYYDFDAADDLNARKVQIEGIKKVLEEVRPDLVKEKPIETEEDVESVFNSKELTEKDRADINAKYQLDAAKKIDIVDEALSTIDTEGDKFFGSTAWKETGMIGYPTDEAKKLSRNPAVQRQIISEKNIEFLQDTIFPELKKIFSDWPVGKKERMAKPLDICQKFLYTTTDVDGKELTTQQANIGGLQSFLVNLSSALNKTPLTAYRVPALPKEQFTDLPGSGVPSTKQVTEEKQEGLTKKYKEEQYITDYDKDHTKEVLESINLPPEQIDEILKGVDVAIKNIKTWEDTKQKNKEPVKKKVKEILDKGVNATMHTKASYKVAKGQEVIDPVYGKGTVIGTDNLENGFVSVAFGPNVVVDQYDAGQIVQPTFEDLPTFECPMDKTIIAADLCIGAMPQEACPFLQFINNAPSCGFISACQKQRDDACTCKEQASTATKQEQEKIASKLNDILKDASFSDHDYFQITEYVPVDVNGIVKKKSANLYGHVIERHSDASLTVRWNDGTESLSWESELNGIDCETGLKLKNAGII